MTPTPPTIWTFNEVDRQAYMGRFWRCPTRLVTEGLWATLWRSPGTTRGGGIVTSLLPVLALHTWPQQNGAVTGWTGWTYLSQRRLATLAGINKDGVTPACRRLVALKHLELERRPRARHEGGYKTYYRLATALYPEAAEPYAAMPGNLFYGGTWALLPSAAVRHLYTVIAGLDPIGDETAYLQHIEADLDGDWDRRADDDDVAIAEPEARATAIRAKILATQRERYPLSLRDLVTYAGLQRSTVIEALRALLVPIFGDWVDEQTGKRYPPISIVKRGEPQPQRPTWYAPNRQAWEWFWKSEAINSPERFQQIRERYWPPLVRRERQG